MISFKELNNDNSELLKKTLSESIKAAASEPYDEIHGDISDAIDILLEDESGTEYAVCDFGGFLLVRAFDFGRYYFICPYRLTENARDDEVISELSMYAIREELPLVITEVSPFDMKYFFGYRHLSLDASDPECSSYTVRVQTECELLDEIPEDMEGRVELNEICEADIAAFAALSKDENVNKYWGYNYLEDESSPSDRYFYETASAEFKSSSAINLAVRYDGEFVGQAVLYAFDGRGGADVAIRIKADAQGKGIASAALLLLFRISERIGLVRLRAAIKRENVPSLKFVSKYMQRVKEDSTAVYFQHEIYN